MLTVDFIFMMVNFSLRASGLETPKITGHLAQTGDHRYPVLVTKSAARFGLNHHNTVLHSTLQERTGRILIAQGHGAPTEMFPLGADIKALDL